MSGINLFTPKAQGPTSITNVAYINFGDVTVVATVPAGATPGSFPIGPGETAGFTVPEGTTHAASICTAGTPIVYFTPGNGV